MSECPFKVGDRLRVEKDQLAFTSLMKCDVVTVRIVNSHEIVCEEGWRFDNDDYPHLTKIGEAPRFREGDRVVTEDGSIGVIRAVVGQLMFIDWGDGWCGIGYTQKFADDEGWKLYEEPKKEPKTEPKMIEIKGKKWSEDTIAQILKEYAG